MVGKTKSVLLIALLVIIAVIIGSSQQVAASTHEILASEATHRITPTSENVTPVMFNSRISAISLFTRDAGKGNTPLIITSVSNPPTPDMLFKVLLHEQSQNPCWIRLAETQSKVITANRVTSETKLGTLKNTKLNRLQQSELLMPISFSKNLVEGSPPGYFLIV